MVALLAAVECVLAGHQVTVFEQGDIPFPGASSFDWHRVMRIMHLGDPVATTKAAQAHYRWIELERLLRCRCYYRTGALTVLPPDQSAAGVSAVSSLGTRARVMQRAELGSNYPHISFGSQTEAVLEVDGGVLLADRILAACVGWLRQRPQVTLCPGRPVVRVDGETANVELADGEVFGADAAIVAVGPWSRRLLPQDSANGLTLYRQSMIYCQVPASQVAVWSATPAIPSLGTSSGAWLVPPVAGTPLKLSAASACRAVDEVDGNATDACWRDHLIQLFGPLIPTLRAEWVTHARDCYYLASTTTGGPLLMALGDAVFCYAACGGISFKFAPLIARTLTRRATGSPVAECIDAPEGRSR